MRRRWPLLSFIGRRLVATAALLVGITLISFLLVQVTPADPVVANLGAEGALDPAVVAAYRERYGLDEPLPVQYWRYLTQIVQGDLGSSQQTQRPVRDDLSDYIPATVELAVPAMVLAFLVSLVLGTIAARRRGRLSDQAIRVVSLFGVSTPPFWLALVAVYLLGFEFQLLPTGGRLSPVFDPPPKVTGLISVDAVLSGEWDKFRDAVTHLVLPVLILAAYTVGLLTRFTRSAVLEVLSRDYVRAAIAKGLPGRTVLLRHILRPALLAIITVSGLAFGTLMTGAVLVERVFSWPGVGQYAYRSAYGLDLPAIMGVTMFVALVYITINLVVDLLYGVIDPRIRVQ